MTSMVGGGGMNGNAGMSNSTATGNALRGKKTGEKIPSGYKKASLQQFTPEQMELLSQVMGNVGPNSDIQRMASGDQSFFEQMEQPFQRQFAAQQGNIASRFSGMGQGSRHGSGFQNQISQASSDFSSDLASRRQGLSRQALLDLTNISGTLLGQRPMENALVEKEKPWWQGALTGFAQGAGQGIGTAATAAAGGA